MEQQQTRNNNKPMPKQNKGEKDEQSFKHKIFTLNKNGDYKELVEILGPDASKGIILINMKTGEEIKEEEDIEDKAGTNYKADAAIKMKKTGETLYPSIKSMKGGKPTILNHTPRSANIFQNKGILNDKLHKIDKVVQKYHEYRRAPGGTEEVKINKLNLDEEDNNTLVELIKNFMFNATGQGLSKCPANSILVINKDDTYTFEKLETIEKQYEYVKKNLSKFDIALVSRKGMPCNIKTKKEAEEKMQHDKKYAQKYEQLRPWIFETDKRTRSNPSGNIILKACLHIRWSLS